LREKSPVDSLPSTQFNTTGAKSIPHLGNYALVIEDGQEIRLSVKGKTALTFLGSLRNSLNDIFEDYKSDNPELEYAIMETPQNAVIYKGDDTILALSESNTPYTEKKTGEAINMTDVAKRYAIAGKTIIIGDVGQGASISVTVIEKEELSSPTDMSNQKAWLWLRRWWATVTGLATFIAAVLAIIYYIVVLMP
jgi:hypothetical protein